MTDDGVQAEVSGGACGFVTRIAARAEDGRYVRLEIASPCAKIAGLAASLPEEVDAFAEVSAGYDGAVWTAVLTSLCGCCSGCVVPAALFKVTQVSAGIALARDAGLRFLPPGADGGG